MLCSCALVVALIKARPRAAIVVCVISLSVDL